jgi:membrane protein involved in colicin uptake
MNNEELVPWIERLNAEPDGKKRNEIVAELCKEKSLKIGDAWNLLKEAGFNPKAKPEGSEAAGMNAGADAAAQAKAAEEAARTEAAAKAAAEAEARIKAEAEAAEVKAKADAEARIRAGKTKPAIIRHKTKYQKYRRAGLVLTQKPETYQVTEAQLEKLRSDYWVVIESGPEQK